ncbi:hypothetical protein TNCV_1189631 [Trichonephila clavipes]|nr:hypothetical protein TNCV_1189631 [Trichonephila clavipes]
MLLKNTAVQSPWDSETCKTNVETERLSRIQFCDYKRESLYNEGEQEVTLEESSKESIDPRGVVLPDIMKMMKMFC